MFMQTQSAFETAQLLDFDTLFTPASKQHSGIAAGTQVESARGWRPVESLTRGDALFTLDGGLCPIMDIRRQAVALQRVLHVPGGALDNCADLTLLPDQLMLLEHCRAEMLFGTPMVLVPAGALVGLRGIKWTQTRQPLESVTLTFADDEIVYGNTGALFHCPAVQQGDDPDGSPFFTVLGMEQARALVAQIQSDAGSDYAARRAA